MVSLVGGQFDTLAQYDVSIGSSSMKFSASVLSYESLVFRPNNLDIGNFSVTICSHGSCVVYCCLQILPQVIILSFQPNVLFSVLDLIVIHCRHPSSASGNHSLNIFCFNQIPGKVTEVSGSKFLVQAPSELSPGNVQLSVCNGPHFGFLKYVLVDKISPSVVFRACDQILTVSGSGFSSLSSITGGQNSRTLQVTDTNVIIGSTWSKVHDFVTLILDGELWNSTILLSSQPQIMHSIRNRSVALGAVIVTVFGNHFADKFHYRCLFGTEAVESRFSSSSSIVCGPWTSKIPGNTSVSVQVEGYRFSSNSIGFQVGSIPCECPK